MKKEVQVVAIDFFKFQDRTAFLDKIQSFLMYPLWITVLLQILLRPGGLLLDKEVEWPFYCSVGLWILTIAVWAVIFGVIIFRIRKFRKLVEKEAKMIASAQVIK